MRIWKNGVNRMSDLISRQAILKHIEKIRQSAQRMDDIRRKSIVMNGMYLGEEAVRNQPSAQPEYFKQIKWERDLAIQQLEELGYGLGEKIHTEQREIIRCKDCRDYTDDYCRRFGDDYGTDFYCGFAERRTDDLQ